MRGWLVDSLPRVDSPGASSISESCNRRPDLPIGHPLLVILLVWFLRDLYLRLRHDVPLDADIDVVALSHAMNDKEPLVVPDAVDAAEPADYQA